MFKLLDITEIFIGKGLMQIRDQIMLLDCSRNGKMLQRIKYA